MNTEVVYEPLFGSVFEGEDIFLAEERLYLRDEMLMGERELELTSFEFFDFERTING